MALSVQQSQRQLIACALEVLADADFALAGSGAIREPVNFSVYGG